MELPDEFVKNIKSEFPDEADVLLDAIALTSSPVSIRYNRAKYKFAPNEKSAVAWCPHGQYLDNRPSFTLDPAFHAGEFYVQEASSMILWHVLSQLSMPDDPVILDLCAAPGGKSTLVLDFLAGSGLLVCNETIKSRVKMLEENVIKWGYTNVAVTNDDPAAFTSLHGVFDLVLIDAPCSGEGMFRKDPESVKEWSPENVEMCSLRQQRIVEQVLPALKENGFIIYSTCTYNHTENLNNVALMAQKHQLSSVDINMADDWNILRLEKDGMLGFQLLPHKQQGEGFFFSVLKKNTNNQPPVRPEKFKWKGLKHLTNNEAAHIKPWIDPNSGLELMVHENGAVYAFPSQIAIWLPLFMQSLHVRYSGLKAGSLNKSVFIPDHALALSLSHHPQISIFEVDKNTALAFLNKTLQSLDKAPKSWLLITYHGLTLGWVKNLGNRINNYFPTELRIRMKIDLPD
ncbi:MAG: hypothetical protein IPN29_10090 [Saprospiraceae bacterium]|nr:hypothetical protein [Saprospiraceae bacterium]